MKITLKKDNIPTKPGYYLLKRPNADSRTELAQIRFIYDELYLIAGISSFPLNKCELDALWSDEFIIEDPTFQQSKTVQGWPIWKRDINANLEKP